VADDYLFQPLPDLFLEVGTSSTAPIGAEEVGGTQKTKQKMLVGKKQNTAAPAHHHPGRAQSPCHRQPPQRSACHATPRPVTGQPDMHA